MPRSVLLLPFCLAAVLLAGCGNKGPLVLPTRPAPSSKAPAPATSTAAPPAPIMIGTIPASAQS